MGKYDWDNLAQNLQKDALTDGKKTYAVDERFYKLARNENDTGGALVRLVADPEGVMFVKMTKIAANIGKDKRFCADWSPQSIGLPDPFNERWSTEWNAGNKEEAKRFGRSIRYISNIQVIKDPANPANEGKFFLLDMSKTIFDKVKAAANPSADEIALGAEPKQVYNPVDGNSFLLKVKRGANNFITYEDSKFDEKTSQVYASDAEFEKVIKENGHKLNDFLKPEFFLTYEELEDKLLWYTGEKDEARAKENAKEKATPGLVEATPATPAPATPAVAPTQELKEAKAPTPAQADEDDLDDFLNDLETA